MADTTIDLLKNSSYIGKMDELIAAVKSGGGATSDVEWDNVKNKPTTIGGYGITDAKIENGTITLGNQTITPLTSAPVTSVNNKTGAVTLSATDVSAIPSTLTGTAGQVLTKTADGQEWKDVDIPTALPNPHPLTFTGAVTGSYDGSEPLTVEIPSGGSGGSDAWNLIDHFTVADAAISYAIPLQPGAKEYGIYWNYTQPSGGNIPKRSIMVDSSLAQYGVMYRCTTNETLFLRVFKGPSNILVTGQGVVYAAQRFSNGGTNIGSGTDFPAMTLTTDITCATSEIWVYWR